MAAFRLAFTEDTEAIGWQPQAKLGDGFFPHAIPKAYGLYMFSQGKAIPIPINDNWDEAATQ